MKFTNAAELTYLLGPAPKAFPKDDTYLIPFYMTFVASCKWMVPTT